LKFQKNLVNVEMNIEKLDIAIAFFSSSHPKNIWTIGIAIPPPPMPPTLLNNMIIENKKVPTHSIARRGKRPLCSHLYLVLDFDFSLGLQT